MATHEMESFLWKFKNLQYAGIKASLTFEAEDGQAFVTLKAGLGFLTPPPSGYQGHARAQRPPAYWRRQERRKAAKAAGEQQLTQAEQAQVEVGKGSDNTEVISGLIAEQAIVIEENTNDVAVEARNSFECPICDFVSNWDNGLKVHMARMHSKIDQLDGHCDHSDDEKYAGSQHYWKKGWLGGAFQSFIDASEVLEECDLPDDIKKIEYEKILDARKEALGPNYSCFPPWSKS